MSPDFLDGLFYLVGFCNPYGLYTHTMYSVLLQAAIVGGAAFLATDSRSMGTLFVTAVLLHSAADFITGQKLLLPGGDMHGLYFYDHPLWDFAVEAPVVLLGWLAARRAALSNSWTTSVWMVVSLLAVQVVFDTTMHSNTTRKPTACFRTLNPVP